MSLPWSTLAKIVYRRTYSRQQNGKFETWNDTTERAVRGNVRGRNVPETEVQALLQSSRDRKGGFAGRGWWFSGTEAHQRIGGTATCNCWGLTADNWEHFVIAQDLLMLGGGVGLSVEHRYVSQMPRVKKGVVVTLRNTKDADFIVPDSREGWCELTRRILEAYFVTGKSFNFSTVCVRGYGEAIQGFGGTASGPLPLQEFTATFSSILSAREGKALRPIDAADLVTTIGSLVVSGNVRRSAILILGDPHDKDYLRAKRWDLGPVPAHRSNANYSVALDDIDDAHPLFWQTYVHGEAFGIVNRKAIQKYGRMGTLQKDSAIVVNPCGEACLENGEPCNLLELALSNLSDADEFEQHARLWFRAGKRVTLDRYHQPISQEVVARNRRVGVGITGALNSSLFEPAVLDRVYSALLDEDRKYSAELGVPLSIRHTVVKPSGTMSKVFDTGGYDGIHPAYSRYIIQRIRFGSNDPLLPMLRNSGHHMEPVRKLDGAFDHGTQVVDFYAAAPKNAPVADEGWGTWKQLDVHQMAQRHWADQAVSVTVYYKLEDIPRLKQWLSENLQNIKTISFLLHSGHGFLQAPKEPISAEQFEKLSARIKPIDMDAISGGDMVDGLECQNGSCPIR
jgi:hypothetical protein